MLKMEKFYENNYLGNLNGSIGSSVVVGWPREVSTVRCFEVLHTG